MIDHDLMRADTSIVEFFIFTKATSSRPKCAEPRTRFDDPRAVEGGDDREGVEVARGAPIE
jgi:hypothetical protein